MITEADVQRAVSAALAEDRRQRDEQVSYAVRSFCFGVVGIAVFVGFCVWPFRMLEFGIPALFSYALWETLTRPARTRRETAEAKTRARRHWRSKGWTDADIDRWDADGDSQWWWIGRKR